MGRFSCSLCLTVVLLVSIVFGTLDVYAQCSALGNISSINTVVAPPSGCAQVSANLTYQITFDSPSPAAGTIRVLFSWGDGSPIETVTVANSQLSYSESKIHAYPSNSDCEYEATTALSID
jgi:hypothetical protein